MSKVIGIDPGQKGAIALLPDMIVVPMPETIAGVRELFKDWFVGINDPRLVVIEKQQPFPKDGRVQAFNFGTHYGELRGLCVALELPMFTLIARQWKSVVLSGRDWKGNKAESIRYVKERYPGLSLKRTSRTKKDSDGMADAVCIAEWGLRYFTLKDGGHND